MTQDQELAVIPAPHETVQLGMLRADTARGMVEAASSMAAVLANVIESKKLFTQIKGRKHVNVEGWGTLIAMLGIAAQEESNIANADGSFTATIVLRRIHDGAIIGRASSDCGDDTDEPWNKRPRYARRSMAATRAMGKACRLSFSWIMALAGYDATPGAEMPTVETRPEPPKIAPQGMWTGKIHEVTEYHGISKGEKKKPFTLYTLHCEDGTQFTSFHESVAKAAKEIEGEVAIEYDTYHGKVDQLRVISIEPADYAASPMTDEDIPF